MWCDEYDVQQSNEWLSNNEPKPKKTHQSRSAISSIFQAEDFALRKVAEIANNVGNNIKNIYIDIQAAIKAIIAHRNSS